MPSTSDKVTSRSRGAGKQTDTRRQSTATWSSSGWRAEVRRQQRWQPAAAPERPPTASGLQPVSGYLWLDQGGQGFLRGETVVTASEPLLTAELVRSLGLRLGDLVDGLAFEDEYGSMVQQVWRVNGHGVENLAQRPHFKQLTAVHPDQAIRLGYRPEAIAGRLLDLVAPIGRGQRGLIVAPPQAGKTTVLERIAEAVVADPELELLVLLVGERPEEATALRRAIPGRMFVADLDAPNEQQTAVVQLAMAHARRLAEAGMHAVVLLDSLTRLARIQNLAAPGGGRTLSGGMDASALTPLRQVFGAARAAEEGGSLTLIATCLIDTGSRLDQVVYEEFKGTGNMEVHLDRRLAQLGLYPAVNVARSGTRREGLLLDDQVLALMAQVRRRLARMSEADALAELLDVLRMYPDNVQALEAILY